MKHVISSIGSRLVTVQQACHSYWCDANSVLVLCPDVCIYFVRGILFLFQKDQVLLCDCMCSAGCSIPTTLLHGSSWGILAKLTMDVRGGETNSTCFCCEHSPIYVTKKVLGEERG